MTAVVPAYPLYPIACILSAGMLLLVLLTSFVRQSWNLGVVFLCFWLFFENLKGGINAIVWSDNADIKLYIYCDITSRLDLITSVVKPMATLTISRRLYLIASLQSVELPDKAMKRRNLVIEWTLGLVIPLLVAGPVYYTVQELRFRVDEGFGCGNAVDDSALGILVIFSWAIIPPLLSITIYYPRVARIFYCQRRDINRFLQSNQSVSRTNYFRILALASLDVLLTFPFGIVNTVLVVTDVTSQGSLPFHISWTQDHAHWEPQTFSYADIISGTSIEAQIYFTQWSPVVLAFAIFGLFGATSEACASYRRVIYIVCGWFGWKPTPRTRRARPSLGEIEFGERPQDVSIDLEMGSRPPSFINPNVRIYRHGTTDKGERTTHDVESGSEMEITEEPRVVSGDMEAGAHRASSGGEALNAPSTV